VVVVDGTEDVRHHAIGLPFEDEKEKSVEPAAPGRLSVAVQDV
jgi:hypothetical protein